MVGHAFRTYVLEYNVIKRSPKDATGEIVLVLAICIAILSSPLSSPNITLRVYIKILFCSLSLLMFSVSLEFLIM